MKYETLEQALEAMDKYQRTKAAYDHALSVLSLDATTAAPSDSWEGRGRTMEVMSEIAYKMETDPEIGDWLAVLDAHRDALTPIQRR
jgi:carboxypeptidase Taq